MAGCLSESVHSHTGVLDHCMRIIHDHLRALILVAVLVVAALVLRLRRRQHKPSPDTEAWIEGEKSSTEHEKASTEDEKTLIELTPLLPALASEYPYPLAHSLFQQVGIPTSGDIARRQLFNNIDTSDLNSGEIAILTPNLSNGDKQHPWRRHSHPQPPSHDHLRSSETETVIQEDVLEFFKDDTIGKLWRRRTLEFGSIEAS